MIQGRVDAAFLILEFLWQEDLCPTHQWRKPCLQCSQVVGGCKGEVEPINFLELVLGLALHVLDLVLKRIMYNPHQILEGVVALSSRIEEDRWQHEGAGLLNSTNFSNHFGVHPDTKWKPSAAQCNEYSPGHCIAKVVQGNEAISVRRLKSHSPQGTAWCQLRFDCPSSSHGDR